jgi:XK-related protein.
MQVLCITASLILLAHTTVSFLWFESQKIMGKKEPWSPKVPIILQTSQPSEEEIDPNEPKNKAEDSGLSMSPLQHRRFPTSKPDHPTNISTCDDDKNSDKQPADIENSTLLPDADIPKPNTNPQEITTAQLTDVTSPPLEQAPPRPDSTNIELPTRKIRQQLNGMKEDDVLGKTVAFLWWFFFLLSRILSLAACANFQPYAMFTVLLHYIIIMAHLLHQTGFPSIYKVFIQLCLGYVFTFCFIEFRYKVKNVTVLYTCYFSLMLTEIIVMSLSWYLNSEDMDGFWYTFTFTVIFSSHAISCLCMASYLNILKPEVKVVYVDERSSPVNY